MADEGGMSSFMSQDEIDAALEAAKNEDAAEEAPPGDAAEDVGADGLLSQADIDAALGGGGDQDPGDLSQADIDAALAGAGLGGGDDAGSGELDQAAIDAALGGGDPIAGMSDAGNQSDERVDSAGNPFDDIAAAMADAIETDKTSGSAEPAAVARTPTPPPPGAQPADMPDFAAAISELVPGAEGDINLLEDVDLNVKIELGRTRMLVEDILQLGDGSVVELDKLAGDPVDVLVNDRLVARGEVLVLNDNFCVRINEIVSQQGEAIRS